MAVKLHFFPMSFWSQVARVALAEKGVDYEPVMVDIAGGHHQTEPAYMRINANGVVPTLEHDGEFITNATRIIREVDQRFDGPALSAADPNDMANLIERVEGLPIRDLTYARKLLPDTENLVAARIAKLEENMAANPDLAEHYRKKIEVQREVQTLVGDEATIARHTPTIESFLDDLEERLGSGAFVTGDTYSLADTVVTPLLVRLTGLRFADRWADGKRANIGRYLGDVRKRPSWAKSIPPPPGAAPKPA